MSKYTYNNSTNTIWTSFDYGEVEVDNLEEATEKAIEKLKSDVKKCNDLLKSEGFTVEMDCTQVEVKLI